MRAFLKKHDNLGCLLDWVVLMTIIGTVMYLLSKVLSAGVLFENFVVALGTEISLSLLYLYFQLIRAEADDRIDYWYEFFNFNCYASGIILVLHSLFGLYNDHYEQVAAALWETGDWNVSFLIFAIEVSIFILNLLLYFIGKRRLWKFPKF